jgi:hypothetical protein
LGEVLSGIDEPLRRGWAVIGSGQALDIGSVTTADIVLPAPRLQIVSPKQRVVEVE